MFKKFLSKSLRFQIITVVIAVICIPLIALTANVAISSYTEKAIIKEHTDRLISTSDFIDKSFNKSLVVKIQNISKITDSDLEKEFSSMASPLINAGDSARIGFYITENEKKYEYTRNSLSKSSDFRGRSYYQNNIDSSIQWVIKNKKSKVDTVTEQRGSIIIRISPIIRNNKVIAVDWEESVIPPDIMLARKNTFYILIFTFSGLMFGLIVTIIILNNMASNINQVVKGLNDIEKDFDCKLPALNGEMGKITESINNMADSLKEKEQLEERLAKSEKLAALGQLISGVAHEIRNPLGIISATAQVMEKDFKEVEGIEEYIHVIKEQAERQGKVIQELLDYARPSKPMFFKTDINPVIESVLSFITHYVKDKNIKIEFNKDDSLPLLEIDVDKIKQVFVNIIINACDAMKEGGLLSINTFKEENYIGIRFKDSGSGINEQAIKNIFNPYFTTKQGGTGLGLAISNQIIEAHNGYISVKSEKNKGTEFIVHIPINNQKEESNLE